MFIHYFKKGKLNCRYLSFLVLLLLVFSSGNSWAIPSPIAIFSQPVLDNGLYRYDFILENTSNSPIDDVGYDLYDFTLYFDSSVLLTDIFSPDGWAFISTNNSGAYYYFINWFSEVPGLPPDGADIGPGDSLSGFGFTSNVRLTSLEHDLTIVNPNDPDPSVTENSPNYNPYTAVPEPMTLLLLGIGLAGLAGMRRWRKE